MSIIDNHLRICEHSIFCFRIDAISLSRLNVLHSSLYQCYCFSSNNIEANLARHEDRSSFTTFSFTTSSQMMMPSRCIISFARKTYTKYFLQGAVNTELNVLFFCSSSTRSQKWEIKISKFLHETFIIYIYIFFPHCQMSYSNPRSTCQVFLLFLGGWNYANVEMLTTCVCVCVVQRRSWGSCGKKQMWTHCGKSWRGSGARGWTWNRRWTRWSSPGKILVAVAVIDEKTSVFGVGETHLAFASTRKKGYLRSRRDVSDVSNVWHK